MNIFITYDFISTTTSYGKRTLEYLKVFDLVLRGMDNVNVIYDELILNRDVLEKLSHQEYNIDEPYRNIQYKDINKKMKNMILDYTNHYDLIIGYELSENTRTIFDKLNIQYLDIWLSPIRFHNDLMFEFYSNDNKINTNLAKYKIKEKKLFKSAQQIIKQKNIMPYIETNSALIIGQVPHDRSVMKQNDFLDLTYYYKEIKMLSLKHNTLYLLKHPLVQKNDFQHVINYFKDIKNIKYIENINTYDLLANHNINNVISISSSVVTEAKYFNKKITFLFKPVISKNYTRIYKKYFKRKFWRDILNINDNSNFEYLVHDNYLRYKMDAFYSYDKFVDRNKNYYNNKLLVNLYNTIHNLDKSKKYIIYGYGSIAKLLLPHIRNNIKGIIDKNISKDYIDNIKVLSIKIISDNDNVIITPIKYQKDIISTLKEFKCTIITLDKIYKK